jgi:hypothetical protein
MDQDLQLALLNQTQALDAWWAELGDKQASLQCACSGEGGKCECVQDSDVSSSAGSNASVEDASGARASQALRNETEHLMSLWMVAHGGGYRRYGYGGWGYGGCRRVGYAGCGCRYYGCHCGHVGYGGCR